MFLRIPAVKISVMTYKSMKKTGRILLAAALMSVIPANAEETESAASEQNLPVIELRASDSNPLETLKQAVIDIQAEAGYLDTDLISMENSTVSVSAISQTGAGLNPATVSVMLSEQTQDEEIVSSIAYSFSQPVLIRNILTDEPEILLKEESIQIVKNDEFNPEEYIAETADSSGILPSISIDSDVDTQKEGIYTVTYTVTNQKGRSSSAELEVEVIAPAYVPGTRVDLSTLNINDDGSVYAMFEAINAVRAGYGLYPYVLAGELGQTAAAIRAQECTYYLAHTRPDGTTYHTVMEQVGEAHGSMVWEILVAYGNTVESNLTWWLNEPGHAAAVLGTFGTTIAIGHSGNVWEAMVY